MEIPFHQWLCIILQEKNDAFANDANEEIDAETLEGYKEMGAFGLQVTFWTFLQFFLK